MSNNNEVNKEDIRDSKGRFTSKQRGVPKSPEHREKLVQKWSESVSTGRLGQWTEAMHKELLKMVIAINKINQDPQQEEKA